MAPERENTQNSPIERRDFFEGPDHNLSMPTSPTDTRHPLARVESLSEQVERDEGLSESYQSTGTIRRRPEPHGTIIEQDHASEHRNSESSTSERPQPQSMESSRSFAPIRSPMLGPERGRGAPKAKKPNMTRRASSNVQAPHRGQEFSVDDDVAEIEGDLVTKPSTKQTSASGYGTLRHQSSTLRRRPTTQAPTLPRVDSHHEGEVEAETQTEAAPSITGDAAGDQAPDAEDEMEEDLDASPAEGDDDDDLSDAESFTLKDRQEAINETHPFGIRIWKPALYKKNRSVQKTAEGDIHSSPGGRVNKWLLFFNILWTVWFGWWLALIAFVGAVVCFICGAAPSAIEYGRVLWGLSGYLFYPFGKFVRLETDETYAQEDEGEGRSITEYEQWQSGDIEDGRLFFGPQGSRSIVGRSRRSIDSAASETDSLLGRTGRSSRQRSSSDRPYKRRLFGRGEWNIGRVIFFLFFYGLITPFLFIVSGICWFLVFWIPMGKVTLLLFYHLRRHPLALSFESDSEYSRGAVSNSSILLCTYRAVGLKYWKYTVDGTNIFLINLMGVVLFVIFDYFILKELLGFEDLVITGEAFLFMAALFSIIPLAYFIGQAVASISAQSSMGLGAAINAFFSTLVEVFLYCVALNSGKGSLVEGSIIGSIFAGILFLPGLSMCFGAIKRKTQRFNAKSAGVTSTMLLFATIAAFGPTLFYQIYGTHELNCLSCEDSSGPAPRRDCRRCYFSQSPTLNDRFYLEAVRPYTWIAAVLLFLSYVIGLWFTLRTHAAVIWNNESDEKKVPEVIPVPLSQPLAAPAARLQRHGSTVNSVHEGQGLEIRDSQLYKRILGQSLKQVGLDTRDDVSIKNNSLTETPNGSTPTPHLPPPKTNDENVRSEYHIAGFTDAQNTSLVREVAEIAATAATIAARDATKAPRRTSMAANVSVHGTMTKAHPIKAGVVHEPEEHAVGQAQEGGGHDAPNWSRMKSSVILCGATVLYALIAEILVGCVDVILKGSGIDEKFLGITLFALVPNTTEFLNAISFAMNGNIALSMEIGSAYALQVCLLQIPALVLWSAFNVGQWIDPKDITDHTFSLIFPQWDMVTVILCVFLLSYMYGEGKSNYFKGSILLLSYLVVITGFYFSGLSDPEAMGASRFDIMTAGGTFKTIGRGKTGSAFQQ